MYFRSGCDFFFKAHKSLLQLNTQANKLGCLLLRLWAIGPSLSSPTCNCHTGPMWFWAQPLEQAQWGLRWNKPQLLAVVMCQKPESPFLPRRNLNLDTSVATPIYAAGHWSLPGLLPSSYELSMEPMLPRTVWAPGSPVNPRESFSCMLSYQNLPSPVFSATRKPPRFSLSCFVL